MSTENAHQLRLLNEYQHLKIASRNLYLSMSNQNLFKSCQQPPRTSKFKQNADGALFFELEKVGVGFILRDCMEIAIMAASISELHILTRLILNLQPFFRPLALPQPRIFNIIVKSDCQLVVNEILQSKNPCFTIGNLLLDYLRYHVTVY